MKKITLSAVLLMALTSLSAFAKSGSEIITASTNANIQIFQDFEGENYKGQFNALLGYDHVFDTGLGLGANTQINIHSNYSSYKLLVGPSYNFQAQDIENSYYVGIKAGVIINHYSGYTYTDSIANLDGGKRFKLAEGIAFSPGLTVSHYFGPGETDPSFTIHIFRFSFIF